MGHLFEDIPVVLFTLSMGLLALARVVEVKNENIRKKNRIEATGVAL
jgi:hypothetical protein